MRDVERDGTSMANGSAPGNPATPGNERSGGSRRGGLGRGLGALIPTPDDVPTAANSEVAIVRGEADAIALRLRHHDDGVHAKRLPSGTVSRAIFNAVEQARCEALGARRMMGTAFNLNAALEERCRTQGFARIVERDAAPLAAAEGPRLPVVQRIIEAYESHRQSGFSS